MVTDLRLIRLCSACATSDAFRATQATRTLRFDKRCMRCGTLGWTVGYVRLATHPWRTFLIYYLVGFGLGALVYLLYCYWMLICHPFVTEYLKQWN